MITGMEYGGKKTGSKMVVAVVGGLSLMTYTYYSSQVLNSLLSSNPPKINTVQRLLDTDMDVAMIDAPYSKINYSVPHSSFC